MKSACDDAVCTDASMIYRSKPFCRFGSMSAVFLCICVSIVLELLPMSGEALDLPFTPSLFQPINSSLPYPTAGSNQNLSEKCTQKYTWLTPGTLVEDCKSALLYFYMEEMYGGGNKRLEFLDRDTKASRHYRRILTPRKYVFRKSYDYLKIKTHSLAAKHKSGKLTSEMQEVVPWQSS